MSRTCHRGQILRLALGSGTTIWEIRIRRVCLRTYNLQMNTHNEPWAIINHKYLMKHKMKTCHLHARWDNCPIKSTYFQAKFAVKISCIKLDFLFFRAPRPQRRKSRLRLASSRQPSRADGSAGRPWLLIGQGRSRDFNTVLWLADGVGARPDWHKLGVVTGKQNYFI